jgi:anti-sigma factor RsiW
MIAPISCKDVQDLLWLHLYGELDGGQEESVEQHLAACAVCAARLQREIEIQASMDLAQAELPAGMLQECRESLFGQLRAARAPAGPVAGWWRRFLDWQAPVWKPAGALALLVLGFAGGRWTPVERPSMQAPEPAAVATRVRALEPDGDGQVRLIVEETRRRTVAGVPSDERIRALLLSAAQDPANPGLRVESMDVLRRQSEAMDVRRALMAALESDPNPGVRLKALDGLRPFAGDPEVRQSLAHVLLRDEHSGLRTQAVDLLIQSKPRDMVGVLQELMQREDNDYIRLRTRRALREMNASVDTF